MSEITINMPQTDAVGLSENWLFKHCGDLHWQRLFRGFGIEGIDSQLMRDDIGDQLYPTFVAIRCRYSIPLASVRPGDRFTNLITMNRFGLRFYNSSISFQNEAARFRLDMLTTFAARDEEGRNALRRSVPMAGEVSEIPALDAPPAMLKLGQAFRHGDLKQYEILGNIIPLDAGSDVMSGYYEPSPYLDYNGAGLLYFAAYPAIADTVERRIIRENRLFDSGRDWAFATSTIGRELFYHRNLDIGDSILAKMKWFERRGREFVIHTALCSARDNGCIADIFTVKRILP